MCLSDPYVICRHLHPLLKVGQQRHDTLHGGHGSSGHGGHVVFILPWRMRAVRTSQEGDARAAGRPRGSERVALGFLEGMAAVGLLLSVIVEGHSMGNQRCTSQTKDLSHFIGVFWGETATLYLVVRGMVVVSSGVAVVVVGLFVNIPAGRVWKARSPLLPLAPQWRCKH
jgi:pimeloyl-ACP methyl ester carboxylesterase